MARTKKAKISSKKPSPTLDAYSAACWTLALTPYFAEILDARIAACEWWRENQPTSLPLSSMEAVGAYIVVYWANYWLNTWPDTIERLEREDADALADDLAAALDANPDVIRPKLRTLQNDLYRLSDQPNDWWNETQRAEAEAETVAAFAEKLEDLSLDVRRSQGNRKRQAESEARRIKLNALILAEVDAATAAVRKRRPWLKPLLRLVDEEIQDRLKGKDIKARIRQIRDARNGR